MSMGGRRRASGDRGTALLESALILPVIIIIVFGIVELGFLYDTAAVTNSATRSGARLGSAQYGSTDNAAERATVLDSVRGTIEEVLDDLRTDVDPLTLLVYRSDAAGRPAGSGSFSSCTGDCMSYTWDGTQFVLSSGSWTNPNACTGTFDEIGIYLNVRHHLLSGVFGGSQLVDEHTVMRLEPDQDC